LGMEGDMLSPSTLKRENLKNTNSNLILGRQPLVLVGMVILI